MNPQWEMLPTVVIFNSDKPHIMVLQKDKWLSKKPKWQTSLFQIVIPEQSWHKSCHFGRWMKRWQGNTGACWEQCGQRVCSGVCFSFFYRFTIEPRRKTAYCCGGGRSYKAYWCPSRHIMCCNSVNLFVHLTYKIHIEVVKSYKCMTLGSCSSLLASFSPIRS